MIGSKAAVILIAQAFFIGLAIGAIASGLGAWLSYRYGLWLAPEHTTAPLRYLLLVTIGLSLLGIAVLSTALMYGYNVQLVLITGAGVIAGFWLVFFGLLAFWLRKA